MNRGFMTIAQNSATGDYVACAAALAASLRLSQVAGPCRLSVMVPAGQPMSDFHRSMFDQVIEFDPAGTDVTQWNAHTKWNALVNSPYDETILMDADMVVPVDLSDWWDMIGDRDLLFAHQPRTYRGDRVDETYNPYRYEFRINGLPNIYTALMYFRKGQLVDTVAQYVQNLTNDWHDYHRRILIDINDPAPTDDMTFACAVRDLGIENAVINRTNDEFTFVHMKTRIQGWVDGDTMDEAWTKHLTGYMHPNGAAIIGNYAQTYPFHYHDRSFMNDNTLAALGVLDD